MGSSAGSISLGSLIVQGWTEKPLLLTTGHDKGLAILKNVAIDPHPTEAKRDYELVNPAEFGPAPEPSILASFEIPPLTHAKLKRLSGRDVLAIFAGFELFSQRGSHVKLRRMPPDGAGKTLIVPAHAEIDTGTSASIYRQALRYITRAI